MANVFLSGADRDIETALLLEKAIIHDIGNAVAYTDGDKIFVNTDDNLFKILPAYDHRMLKWLLWHEEYHKQLRHHNRFFKYLHDLTEAETMDEFHVTKNEVNIIMDILVHDSLAKLFPDLVETAMNNLAQFRNRNSLGYTFKTFTLEEMLDEYKRHKHGEPPEEPPKGGTPTDDPKKKGTPTKKKGKGGSTPAKEPPKGKGKPTEEKGHGAGGGGSDKEDTPVKDKAPEIDDTAKRPDPTPEHDKTDWSKLKDIDSKEFITKEESNEYIEQINKLRRTKLRMAKVTQTLNGLVTTSVRRTYAKPSRIQLKDGIVLKGREKGRAQLYLVFDASGSMGRQLQMFKDIISKSIPQAMETPCEWFSGYNNSIEPYKYDSYEGYYKGKFKDIMNTEASSGYCDDGDRTIELCWQAEQLGYSPIGVTDGGGKISWSKDQLKQLKRTILVGQNPEWLEDAKKINPRIQTLDV